MKLHEVRLNVETVAVGEEKTVEIEREGRGFGGMVSVGVIG